MRCFAWIFVSLVAFATFPQMSAQSPATVEYNVVDDFSTASNPNGPWSYLLVRSFASNGEIDGKYAPLEVANPLKNDIGWGQLVTSDVAVSFFQLTDDEGGKYWLPDERDHLAMRTATLASDEDRWQAPVLAWTAPSDGVVEINYTVKNISTEYPVSIALDKLAAGSLVSISPLTPVDPGETTTLKFPGIAVKAGDQIQFYRDAYVNQADTILLDDTSMLRFTPGQSSGVNSKKTP